MVLIQLILLCVILIGKAVSLKFSSFILRLSFEFQIGQIEGLAVFEGDFCRLFTSV